MARPWKISDPVSYECWRCTCAIDRVTKVFFGPIGRLKCEKCGPFTDEESVKVREEAAPEIARFQKLAMMVV